jgi:hypothetical protein
MGLFGGKGRPFLVGQRPRRPAWAVHSSHYYPFFMAVLFSNRFVTVTTDEIVVETYYFPFGNKKHIPISKVARALVKPNPGLLHMKHWGMALSKIWWPLDWSRHSRERYIHIEVEGSWVAVGITMDDAEIDQAIGAIRQAMAAHRDENRE